MVNYCVAPGCAVGGRGDQSCDPEAGCKVSTFRFPKNKELRRIWETKVPRADFLATDLWSAIPTKP